MNISEERKNHSDKNIKLSYVKCDFCNSNNYEILIKTKDYFLNKVPGEFSIVRCLDCNLIYTNPRLLTELLTDYYLRILKYGVPSKNLKQQSKKISIFRRYDILTEFFNYPFLRKKKLRKLKLFLYYLRIKKGIKNTLHIPPFIKNGKILEFGCAYGGYLYQLKKLGWDVKGIELNKNAVDYAVKKLNLNIECISIEDFESKELFNIIYMKMVLEHLESPKKILKKCYSLLKSNGKLVLIIPDFSGLEKRIYKKYAYTLQLPFHLYHFTPKSIKNYLKELNYKKIKIIHGNFDRDLIAPLTFIIREHPDKILVKYLQKLSTKRFIRKTLIKFIIYIFSFLGKTSRMTVVARK